MSENLPAKRIDFKNYMRADITQSLIQRTLGSMEHAQRFSAAILSSVSINPGLQECDPKTILSGAFLGDALQLPPNPQLGRFYLVPFNDKKNPYGKVAVFVLGFKGYIELAIRTGQYRNIIAFPVKEGEITKPWDPMSETIGLKLFDDEDKREKMQTVGYYAQFEMLNGFRKAMYWSKDKMLNHADQFSAAFKKTAYKMLCEGKIPENDMWKYSSFWYKNFDEMGLKTMLRQLISKWGIMSVDIQRAFEADDHIVSDVSGNNDQGVYIEIEDTEDDDAPDFVKEAAAEKKGKRIGEV